MDIAINNTKLITFKSDGLGIIEEGALGIEDGRITYVGKNTKLDADIVIDGHDKLTMPGLVNAHTHTGITLLRGCAQDMPEIQWMNKGIGPFAQQMKASDMLIGSKLGVMEGLRTGTTTFAEYSYDVGELVEKVYKPFGARVVAIETLNEVISKRAKMGPDELYEFGSEKGEKCLKKARKVAERYKNDPMVDYMYGPQALDMVSMDLLSKVKELADKEDKFIHMHIAQGERERRQIANRYGKSTVELLDDMGFLSENFLAAHCHDTSVSERSALVEKGVKMVGCPSSIAMIDGIVPPVEDFLKLGGIVGLGSDQAPGPGTHNMFKEMRNAALLSKVRHSDPTSMPSWKTLKLGTIEGAKALGLKGLGALKKGMLADVITIELNRINLVPSVNKPFHNFIPNLVYSSTGYEVDNVIINGELVLKDGEFLSIDEEKIKEQAQERAEVIFEEGSIPWREAGSDLVDIVDEGSL